jgi:tetratricopeptide (TPR) repeat protein
MRRTVVSMLLVCVALLGAAQVPPAKSARNPKSKASSKILPLTTASSHARELFEKGMQDYENLYLDQATQDWRDAVAADPNFALAHAWVAFNSNNPAEVVAERERAKALAESVTPGEQLMIKWIADVQENKFVTGIAAMNDMLAMYPKDKRLLYLAANWLMGEEDNERARVMCERALKIDKDYPAALNDLAYSYAREGTFPPAFAAMERYIKVLPNEPNPQDSYAEILRLSGNFEGALEHYRAALKINSKFYTSQLGLGDTYALMGDQERARAEYQKAIDQDPNEANCLNYALQSAMTWVRENKLEEADKAFSAVAEQAHAKNLVVHEARAHRFMSLYQADPKLALTHLEQAESVINHRDISEWERQEEKARILRLRVTRAMEAGNQKLANKSLRQLETMAKESRNTVILQSYHAAAGALEISQEKYKDAISNLQEDPNDPFSLELLSRAYHETGAVDDLHTIQSKLKSINTPTLEQALVVIPARAKRPVY